MKVIQSFDPALTKEGDIDVGSANTGSKILLYNLSTWAIILDFENGNTAILHAGEANYWTLDGTTPSIHWSQYSMLAVYGQASSIVTGQVFGTGERIEGTYPMSLTYQLNVGNAIPVSTSASSVTNDGNAGGISVVESTQSGAPASNVAIDNAGNATFAEYVAGIRSILLQLIAGASTPVLLGAAGRYVEILGQLRTDGTGDNFLSGTTWFGATSPGPATAVVHANGNAEFGGSVQLDNGASLAGGTMSFLRGSASQFVLFAGLGGAGNIQNNVSHGCSVIPNAILVSYWPAGHGGFGSEPTVIPHASNITSSTCSINCQTNYNYVALAIVL